MSGIPDHRLRMACDPLGDFLDDRHLDVHLLQCKAGGASCAAAADDDHGRRCRVRIRLGGVVVVDLLARSGQDEDHLRFDQRVPVDHFELPVVPHSDDAYAGTVAHPART